MRPQKILFFVIVLLTALVIALLLRSPAIALLGDVDLNNLVNQADLNAIAQRLGLKYTDATYQKALDLNLDDKIDVFDLAIAGRSYRAARIFHYTRQISNCKNCAYEQDSCLDGLGRINIVWSGSSEVYYSRLDRFGNTLIDDYLLSTVSSAVPVGIACGSDGTAHLFWKKGDYLYQARFDRWGYPVISPQKVYDERISEGGGQVLGAALDSQGNAYAFFRRYPSGTPTLLRVTPQGELLQSAVGLLSGDSNTTSLYHRLAVDASDNLHLAWYELEGLDRIYYARYASGSSTPINERVVGYTNYDGSVNSARREELEVDAQGNAYLLWRKHGTTKLFLEKIGSDGKTPLDDYELFTQWGNDVLPSDFDLDELGRIHLLTLTDWGRSVSRSAYGTFTSEGVPIEPLRWILYKLAMRRPRVMVDNRQDTQITFSTWDSTGYPPCEDYTLCYMGTAFDAPAYDLSRSDLGVDAAHLSYQPLIARWNGTVATTTTVFNEGWASAPASSLWIGLETEDGQILAETTQAVNPLALHAQQIFQNIQLTLPNLPPEGMEEIEYLRLRFKVDPQNALAETTEANNELSVPILVQKLPTKTGLFLVVEDETNTVRGGDNERVSVGTAAIQGGSYSKTAIPVTDELTVLARDIPVTGDLVNYTISWQADGYTVPTPAVIGVKRNSGDPYRIDFTPNNTAVLKTNRWGSLSGTITNGGGAKVRLVGQGLSIETTADASGNFSPTTEAKLGKLIPGEYQIRISKAGYARLSETITIHPLGAHTFNRTMNTTTEAYLHGNVINAYGTPVSGATVRACSATTQTDANGVFDLDEVAASCTKLEITRSGYAKLEEPLSLTAGLETLLDNLVMTFDPPVTLISKEGRVASRVINQSTGDLLPDPPDDANWLQKQVFEEFSDTFWPDYRIYVAYGAYEYTGAAAYSGPSDDRRMQFVEVYFKPLTFEVHALLATINIEGVPITIPIVSDSGIRSAIQVIEARLINVKTGQVLKRVEHPLEGQSEWIYEQGLLTYNFEGIKIDDWANTQVWLYYKVGRNTDGKFTSSPLLYQHDRQIMKFNLSGGTIWLEYGLGEFPMN